MPASAGLVPVGSAMVCTVSHAQQALEAPQEALARLNEPLQVSHLLMCLGLDAGFCLGIKREKTTAFFSVNRGILCS